MSTDPISSIAEAKPPTEGAASSLTPGASPGPEAGAEPKTPGIGQRLGVLFLPCPEDPLKYDSEVAKFINKRLGAHAGIEPKEVEVGQNVVHCINHVFPGGGASGWPPIVNLVRSYLDYRAKAQAEQAPDEPIRPGQ